MKKLDWAPIPQGRRLQVMMPTLARERCWWQAWVLDRRTRAVVGSRLCREDGPPPGNIKLAPSPTFSFALFAD